jgi:hypothetical protein
MATNTEPAWYQNMINANAVNQDVPDGVIIAPGGPFTIRGSEIPDGITLRSGAEEMIRCSTEGFWVRGVKVAQDDKEAEHVYNTFKQWLVWAQLTGQA